MWAPDGTLLASRASSPSARLDDMTRSATSAWAPTSATAARSCRPASTRWPTRGVSVLRRRRARTRPTRSARSSTSRASSTRACGSTTDAGARGAAGRLQGGRARAGPRAARRGLRPPRAAPDRRRPAPAGRRDAHVRAPARCRTRRCSARRFVLDPAARAGLRAGHARRRRAAPTRSRPCPSRRACAARARRWRVRRGGRPDAARRRRRQHPDALRRRPTASGSSSTGASRPCATSTADELGAALRNLLELRGLGFADLDAVDRLLDGAAARARVGGDGRALPRPRDARRRPRRCGPAWRSATTTRARSAPTASSTRSPACERFGGPASCVDFGTAIDLRRRLARGRVPRRRAHAGRRDLARGALRTRRASCRRSTSRRRERDRQDRPSTRSAQASSSATPARSTAILRRIRDELRRASRRDRHGRPGGPRSCRSPRRSRRSTRC